MLEKEKNGEELLTCPFCQESDFDLSGLKSHLLNWCEEFQKISGFPQRQLTNGEYYEC